MGKEDASMRAAKVICKEFKIHPYNKPMIADIIDAEFRKEQDQNEHHCSKSKDSSAHQRNTGEYETEGTVRGECVIPR